MYTSISITSDILMREASLKGRVSKAELLKFIEDNWIEVDPEPKKPLTF